MKCAAFADCDFRPFIVEREGKTEMKVIDALISSAALQEFAAKKK